MLIDETTIPDDLKTWSDEAFEYLDPLVNSRTKGIHTWVLPQLLHTLVLGVDGGIDEDGATIPQMIARCGAARNSITLLINRLIEAGFIYHAGYVMTGRHGMCKTNTYRAKMPGTKAPKVRDRKRKSASQSAKEYRAKYGGAVSILSKIQRGTAPDMIPVADLPAVILLQRAKARSYPKEPCGPFAALIHNAVALDRDIAATKKHVFSPMGHPHLATTEGLARAVALLKARKERGLPYPDFDEKTKARLAPYVPLEL